ncbi:MAG: acyl-CoA dehydrogenase family protein [Firmicutes bacterium]|nr:acyl-CoA dehydrogenase family protein [Bacillota bacterium]
MPYLLTEEQKMMRDMVRKLCQNEIAPRAAQIDRTHAFPWENIKRLAELPSREVLIGRVLGSMQAPLYSLVNVLQANVRNLVWVLEAVRKQKAGEAAAG